jgi:HSF-type DNA-binding
MIDSCDPNVAGWDEDGLTFTVKDPNQFETKIIPQFFKHSKFSSFVRVRLVLSFLNRDRLLVTYCLSE